MPDTVLEDAEVSHAEHVLDAGMPARPVDTGFTDEDMREMGYLCWRRLPDGDYMGVVEMTFGKGRLCMGLTPSGYEQGYCYSSIVAAIAGMTEYRPGVDKEPQGWFRDVTNGRRRPDGDPSQEHIAF